MLITTSDPSYLELWGLFTVHTNVSTNARLSFEEESDTIVANYESSNL